MNICFYLHDENNSRLLEKRLLWLSKRYEMISWKDIMDFYEGKRKLKNTCHITIDDGWLSTYQIVYPLLRKYNIPATIFVSPYIINEEKNFWYYDYKQFDEIELKKTLIKKNLFNDNIYKYPIELIFKEMKIFDVLQLLEEFKLKCNTEPTKRGFINKKELLELNQSDLIEIGAHTLLHPILSNEDCHTSYREITYSINELRVLLNRVC